MYKKSIEVYEVTNETAKEPSLDSIKHKKLYIAIDNITTANNCFEIESEKYVPFSNLKIEHQCLKYIIKNEVNDLYKRNKGNNKILLASYRGKMPQNADIENMLFYNIGTGLFAKFFSGKKTQQAAFWVEDNNDGQHIKYRYEINNIPKNIADKLENPLAKWENITIGNGNTLPEKPDEYFTALRTNINNNEITINSKEQCKTSFGIKITLTVPESNKTTHPVSVMKHLLDGVICAFHGEKGETAQMLQEKFEGEKVTCQTDWHILGDQDYLRKYRNGFKWYPADEANRLKFGWIIVKCDGKEYKMSGEIYKWD